MVVPGFDILPPNHHAVQDLRYSAVQTNICAARFCYCLLDHPYRQYLLGAGQHLGLAPRVVSWNSHPYPSLQSVLAAFYGKLTSLCTAFPFPVCGEPLNQKFALTWKAYGSQSLPGMLLPMCSSCLCQYQWCGSSISSFGRKLW